MELNLTRICLFINTALYYCVSYRNTENFEFRKDLNLMISALIPRKCTSSILCRAVGNYACKYLCGKPSTDGRGVNRSAVCKIRQRGHSIANLMQYKTGWSFLPRRRSSAEGWSRTPVQCPSSQQSPPVLLPPSSTVKKPPRVKDNKAIRWCYGGPAAAWAIIQTDSDTICRQRCQLLATTCWLWFLKLDVLTT